MAHLFFIIFHFIAIIFGFWLLLISVPLHIFYANGKRRSQLLEQLVSKQQTNEVKTEENLVRQKYPSLKRNTIILVAIAFSVTLLLYLSSNFITPEENKKIFYLDKQTQSVKNCVKTLGEGVYAEKSLQWKLKNCNAKY